MKTPFYRFYTVFSATLFTCAACGSAGSTAGEGGAGAIAAGASGTSNSAGTASSGAGASGAGNPGASGAPSSSGASAGGGAAPATGGDNGFAGSAGAPVAGMPGVAGAGNVAGSSSGGSAGTSNSAVTFDTGRVTVTGVRGTTTPSATAAIKLHNFGSTPVQVKGLMLSGPNQALFQVTSPTTFPMTLAVGADLAVTVAMATTGATLPAAPADKNTGCVFLTGTLTATLDSSTVSASVYGLVLTLVNYEATLGQILTALGYKVNVGKAQNNWNPNTSMNATSLPGVEAGTDEVAASRFVKAATGNVSMTLVARFSPMGALPYGWYTTTSGCPAGCTTVGTMAMLSDAQTSDKARMVNPPPGAGSMTSFDPGSSPFGLWVYSDQKTQKFEKGGNVANGDWDYSQDALNTPANAHRIKTYPLKDAAGTLVPKTYLVAIEEAGNGDYQDYVFVLSNVTPMP